MKRTIWILALCIGAVLADTSEDLIDYINISNANLQCEEYCNGIFVPYEANDDDACDDKTLEDFDDQAETPSFTSFCHTFYETTTVSTPYGGSKTEVKISNICTCGFVIFRNWFEWFQECPYYSNTGNKLCGLCVSLSNDISTIGPFDVECTEKLGLMTNFCPGFKTPHCIWFLGFWSIDHMQISILQKFSSY